MAVADRIDTILQERGLSRRQLAIKAGIPPSSLQSALERGHNITLETLQKIAAALDMGFMVKKDGEVEFYEFRDAPSIDHPGQLEAVKAWAANRGKNQLNQAYDSLNEKGQQVAVERVEELAKIPDYQKETSPK